MKLKCLKPFTKKVGKLGVAIGAGDIFDSPEDIAAVIIKEGYAEEFKEVIEQVKTRPSRKTVKPVEEDVEDGISEE